MEETVNWNNRKLNWKYLMTAEDRRKNDDKNWQDIRDFMDFSKRQFTEANLYRIMDKEIQANILAEAKKTNGRITNLETFQNEIEIKIQDRKDSKANLYTFIAICISVVSTIAAIVMAFKK